MTVYHYSPTLKEGDAIEPGHLDLTDLCEPFVRALEHGGECFLGMLLSGRYMYAVMNRSDLRCWADYAKWATEGLFEYVRRKEFPHCVSRLKCGYYCTELEDCLRMYNEDYGEEDEEERAKVRLFEVELPEESLEKRDVSLYDEAYDAISESEDIKAAFELARRYFSGLCGKEPNFEYLSAAEGVAVRDISHYLRNIAEEEQDR